jgi:CheY-specific phosphatase CheX
MTAEKTSDNVQEVMQSAIGRTRSYFESEFCISGTDVDTGGGDLDSLTLLDMTAIIGMGGRINLLIAFSFQDGLINALYQRMTEGMEVQPDEVEMYREAAAGEVVNTVLGHCTIDLQEIDDRGISMTPPVILDKAKTIRRMKNSMFYTQSHEHGPREHDHQLWWAPRELFETNLDYAK